jgi:6-phosphofructokinase 1
MVICAEGIDSTAKVTETIRTELGLDPRVTILGYIQRGGSPTARDRVAAARMGYRAVKVFADGGKNRIICEQGGQIVDIDIDEALAMTKGISPDSFDILEALAGGRGG